MLNQVVLVGRLASDIEVKETESGKKFANMVLAVPRPFKNEEGVYETDFISCNAWNTIAENTAEYCKKGDIIGVKGRLQMDQYTDKESEKPISKLSLTAEKVTFLSSSKEKNTPEVERD